jgi:hypothetical protein
MALIIRNYRLTGRDSDIEMPVGAMVLGCDSSYRSYGTGWNFPNICCLIDEDEKCLEARRFFFCYTEWSVRSKARFIGIANYLSERVFIFEECADG